jgi:hypothetical protein
MVRITNQRTEYGMLNVEHNAQQLINAAFLPYSIFLIQNFTLVAFAFIRSHSCHSYCIFLFVSC